MTNIYKLQVKIDKSKFIELISSKGYSLRKLDSVSGVCEKTIRTNLNNGVMPLGTFIRIMDLLEIDTKQIMFDVTSINDVKRA